MILGKNDKLLFIGDSISDYDRKKPVGEGLFNAWGTSYVADAGALLCCMYPELNLRIVNMGISGNQIRDLDERWQTDVLDQKPDHVSVLIGINDVWRLFDSPQMTEQHVPLDEYEAIYRKLIEKTFPTHDPHDPVLHGTQPKRPHAGPDGRIRRGRSQAGGGIQAGFCRLAGRLGPAV